MLASFNLSPQNTGVDVVYLLTAGASAIASIYFLAVFTSILSQVGPLAAGPAAAAAGSAAAAAGPPAAEMVFVMIAIGCYVSVKIIITFLFNSYMTLDVQIAYMCFRPSFIEKRTTE